VKWVPAAGDEWYSQLGITTDAAASNAIIVSCTGLPATVGLRVKVTWVVEWTPKVNLGLTHDPTSVGASSNGNGLDKVLSALKRANPTWWMKAGEFATYAYQSAASAYGAYKTVRNLLPV
jgi:hypothetical protein